MPSHRFLVLADSLCSQIGSALLDGFPTAVVMTCRDVHAAGRLLVAEKLSLLIVQSDDPVDGVERLHSLHSQSLRTPSLLIAKGDDAEQAAKEAGASAYLPLSKWKRIGAMATALVARQQPSSSH